MTTASSSSNGKEQGPAVGDRQHSTWARAEDEARRLPERIPAIKKAPFQFHGHAPQADHIHAILHPDAVETMAQHARSDAHREVGGVLLGAAYRHEGKLFVEVRHALPAQTSDHGPIHFTFNADAWSQIHRDREAQHPGHSIVGWFHTHPGLGVFFSADDLIVHSAAFVMPWHIALVVDPVSQCMGSFAWCKGRLVSLPGFYLLSRDEKDRTPLPWRLKQGEIWEETYMERVAQKRQQNRRRSRFVEAGVEFWPALLVALVVFTLVAGLYVGVYAPLRNQNETLLAVVTSLANQSVQEANTLGVASCPDPSLRIFSPPPGGQVASGNEIAVIGAADVANAGAYRLDVRPTGESAWWSLGTFRQREQVGQFLIWDTTSFASGVYDLQLVALDEIGNERQNPPPCIMQFEILAGAEGDG